jgi:hypothetical protein
MVMGCFLSVVIDIIYVLRVTVKAENHPPVGPDSYGPKTFHRSFERMQPEPRHVHMGNGWGSVKRRQNITQLADVFRVYAARVVLFKKPFQSLVADCPESSRTVTCHVAHVKNNSSSSPFPLLESVRARAERVARA